MSARTPTRRRSCSRCVSSVSHPMPCATGPAACQAGRFVMSSRHFTASHPSIVAFVARPLYSALALTNPVRIRLVATVDDASTSFVIGMVSMCPRGFRCSGATHDCLGDSCPVDKCRLVVHNRLFEKHFHGKFSGSLPFGPRRVAPIGCALCSITRAFLPKRELVVRVRDS